MGDIRGIMATEFYERYIRSPAWQKKRRQRMAIDRQCVMCHKPLWLIEDVQIHHIHYKNLGNEDVMNDICTLCGECHIKIHNYYNRKRRITIK